MADKVYHFIPPQDPEEGIGEVDRAIADQNGNVIDETYATEKYVDDAIAQIDISAYATKEYVDDAIAQIDVSTYATKEYVNDAVATKSAVSGTSDDTNWTSLTIDGVTHDIPQGGGGSDVVIDVTSGSESISDGTNTINVATRDTIQRFTAPKSFFNDTTNNTLPLRIQGFHNHTWGLEMDKDFGRLHFKYADANGTNISNVNDQLVLDFLSLYPATNGGKDLGTTSNRWQHIYFTGGLRDGNNANYGLVLPDTTSFTSNKTIATTDDLSNYVDLTSAQEISGTKTFIREIDFKSADSSVYKAGIACPGNNKIGFGNAPSSASGINTYITMDFSSKIFYPGQNGQYSLGTINGRWKDLYLSGDLSDGTNAVSVAHLAQNTPTQWYGTQAEYDALGTYDSNTIYNILES